MERQPGKTTRQLKKDTVILLSVLPKFMIPGPWKILFSILGSPKDWIKRRHEPYNEISFLLRSLYKQFNFLLGVEYSMLCFWTAFYPPLGSIFWLYNHHSRRILVKHNESYHVDSGLSVSETTSEAIKHTLENDDNFIALEDNDPQGPKQNPKLSERWFFINGVCAEIEIVKLNAMHLSSLFKRDIEVIHNPTFGILLDMSEVVLGRTFNIASSVCRTVQRAIWDELQNPKIKKIVLIAHSQGTIIACNSIERLILKGSKLDRERIRKKVEIYNFASVSATCAMVDDGPIYENFINPKDVVAVFGNKELPKIDMYATNPAVPKKSIQFTSDDLPSRPKIFVNKDKSKKGHLLSAHYLKDFIDEMYECINMEPNTKSKLWTYIK